MQGEFKMVTVPLKVYVATDCKSGKAINFMEVKWFDSMVWKVVGYGAQSNPFVKLEAF